MYESPIKIFSDNLYTSLNTQLEDEIMKAVWKVGVMVDRDELIRALRYDRDQYEKGYEDALRELREKTCGCIICPDSRF